MGRTGILLAIGLVATSAACTRDTAIVVEVDWDPTALDSTADTLRIYVGTETADPAVFATNPGTTAISLAGLTSPYRYLLRPDGEIDAIGELQLAAAFTAGDTARPIAFATAPTPIEFADGEVRTVVLAPIAQPFAVSGAAFDCVTWAAAGAGPLDRAIGSSGNNDCDPVANDADCQPFNPRIFGVDLDGDQSICDDCLEGTAPVDIAGWRIDPASVFPGQTEDQFRVANAIPDNVACTHIDFDCSGSCAGDSGDPDGSGSDACGQVTPGATLACAAAPSDCNENIDGDTPVFGHAEICDGADESCDRRPAPNLPCPIIDPNGCRVGREDCDDARGVFGACTPVEFPHALDTATCGVLTRVDGCRFDDDPLQCAGGNDSTCLVAPSGPGCPDERMPMPGIVGATGCDWRIIGGIDHAEWVIGFASADSANLPREEIPECAPLLVAHAVHPNPTPRTVLILGQTSTAVLFARFVTFTAAGDPGDCDGVLLCSTLGP